MCFTCALAEALQAPHAYQLRRYTASDSATTSLFSITSWTRMKLAPCSRTAETAPQNQSAFLCCFDSRFQPITRLLHRDGTRGGGAPQPSWAGRIRVAKHVPNERFSRGCRRRVRGEGQSTASARQQQAECWHKVWLACREWAWDPGGIAASNLAAHAPQPRTDKHGHVQSCSPPTSTGKPPGGMPSTASASGLPSCPSAPTALLVAAAAAEEAWRRAKRSSAFVGRCTSDCHGVQGGGRRGSDGTRPRWRAVGLEKRAGEVGALERERRKQTLGT